MASRLISIKTTKEIHYYGTYIRRKKTKKYITIIKKLMKPNKFTSLNVRASKLCCFL